MDVDSEEPVNRRELLQKYLSADGVMSSEKRWWTGSQGFDFKNNAAGEGSKSGAAGDSNVHTPSSEVQ